MQGHGVEQPRPFAEGHLEEEPAYMRLVVRNTFWDCGETQGSLLEEGEREELLQRRGGRKARTCFAHGEGVDGGAAAVAAAAMAAAAAAATAAAAADAAAAAPFGGRPGAWAHPRLRESATWPQAAGPAAQPGDGAAAAAVAVAAAWPGDALSRTSSFSQADTDAFCAGGAGGGGAAGSRAASSTAASLSRSSSADGSTTPASPPAGPARRAARPARGGSAEEARRGLARAGDAVVLRPQGVLLTASDAQSTTVEAHSGTDDDEAAGVAAMALAAGLPSIGSMGHSRGDCKPCAFLRSRKGCFGGLSCVYCHACEPGERRRRQKEKKKMLSSMKRLGAGY